LPVKFLVHPGLTRVRSDFDQLELGGDGLECGASGGRSEGGWEERPPACSVDDTVRRLRGGEKAPMPLKGIGRAGHFWMEARPASTLLEPGSMIIVIVNIHRPFTRIRHG